MSISFYTKDERCEEVNMCNRNALMVMRFLGLEEEYCGTISNLKEFISRCDEALNTISAYPELDPEVHDVETEAPNGARVIDCGVPAGYLIGRITDLRNLAVRAQAANNQIFWA